jgi:uncharacterized protein (TIGR02268 family)
LELVAEPQASLPPVCISPGLPTAFHFDAPLPPGTTVVVEERQRFGDVSLGDNSFSVLPLEEVQPGGRFKATVRFADGAAPTRVSFELVVHPAWAPRKVEVFRHRRTVEDYQQETQEEREKAQRLSQELQQLQREHGPGGLAALFAAEVLLPNATGVLAKDVSEGFTPPALNALPVYEVHTYRAATPRMVGEQRVMRVAVTMKAKNTGQQPWRVHEAALLRKGQEARKVKVWPLAPILPNQEVLLVVETELLEEEARSPFALKLWDASGSRLVTVGNVTFP